MKKLFFSILIVLLCLSTAKAQIISQYIETSSGSTPKGIEIWNNTSSALNFATNILVIEKGTNGAIPSPDFTLSSGTLAANAVLVIGTSDMQTITESNGSTFHLKAFTFNGDDALVVKYGGVITDVLGVPGSDPGTAWSGSGVSTADRNIAIKVGITTGDTDGWIDPSLRFETVSTNNSATGFGIAPLAPTPSITLSNATLSNFNYVIEKGPSGGQSFVVSGIWLSENITITPSPNYEISLDNISFQSTAITLSQLSGTVANTTVYTRLKTGLSEGVYNENISLTSTGVPTKTVLCTGRVCAIPNAWINEFHYDNNGTDEEEAIEIIIKNAADYNLADFSLSLYNGGDGTVYGSQTVNNFTAGQTLNGYSVFYWKPSSLQNGPDGFSLNYLGTSVQFVSYEGSFNATDGPATGLTSTRIYTVEGSTTPVGNSLQLTGSGNIYSHFVWGSQQASLGSANNYQLFGEYIPPVPVDWKFIVFAFLIIGFTAIYRKVR